MEGAASEALEKIKFSELEQKALDQLILKLISQKNQLLLNHGKPEAISTNPYFLTLIQQLEDLNDEIPPSIYEKAYGAVGILLTINPPKETDIQTFKNQAQAVALYLTNNLNASGLYSFEQRSTDPNEIHGYHAHFIFARDPDTNITDQRKKIRSKIKTLKIFTQNPNHHQLNFRYVKTPGDLTKCINYVLGKKKDPSKLHKVQVDIKFREMNNIKEYYEF